MTDTERLQQAWDERLKRRLKVDKIWATGSAMISESMRLKDEADRLWAKARQVGPFVRKRSVDEWLSKMDDRMFLSTHYKKIAEARRLGADGSAVMAEGNLLRAEIDQQWLELVLEVCGNITLAWHIDGAEVECRLETGAVFSGKAFAGEDLYYNPEE